ncbi:hypothetical protein FQN57_007073 [Myotisia sp. PD_48]|nr:hypothetical protein FQN57_007073 [Myotisia sp. PD_48]
MSSSPSFGSSVTITHIGTATAILEIDGIRFLTDPFFSPANTEWDMGIAVLKNSDGPALNLQDIPPIDIVLLSHEDHPDNLDELGRRLLDGRRVLTTQDGAKKLAPRPGVRGIRPWETVTLEVGGKHFEITGTPCQHLPGGECVGFIVTSSAFGYGPGGLPNAIFFSGDTVYIEELVEVKKRFHIVIALVNLGAATVPLPTGPLLVTMDGAEGAKLFQEIQADILVPMHYESWGHFTQGREELTKVFEEKHVQDRVCWLTPGVPKKIF